jgi:hypothetical protein
MTVIGSILCGSWLVMAVLGAIANARRDPRAHPHNRAVRVLEREGLERLLLKR